MPHTVLVAIEIENKRQLLSFRSYFPYKVGRISQTCSPVSKSNTKLYVQIINILGDQKRKNQFSASWNNVEISDLDLEIV